MEQYIVLLIKEFITSKNIRNPDIKSELFIQEFTEWINERKLISNNYIAFLSAFDIQLANEPSTVEIGKGKYDSITTNNRMSRITPYLDKEECHNLLIKGRLIVQGDRPLVLFTPTSHPIDLTSITALTYVTQNPYSKKDIRNWDELYNYLPNSVVLGVYGSTSDKDIESKINMLLEIKDKIHCDITEAYATKNGSYYYAIGKNSKVLKRVK